MSLVKNCLIIGGGSDIGGAIVRQLHTAGYNVFATYFKSGEAAKNLPCKTFKCDLSSITQTKEVMKEISNVMEGQIDLLVTSAFPFLEGDAFDFQSYLAAEEILRGHILVMTLARKKMAVGAKIINILGQCVERGLPGAAFYSAAFAFLNNYGNSINGREGKHNNMSVCSLLLGPVDTREWSGLSPEILARYKSKVAGFITTKQIAETVQFIFQQAIVPSTFKLDAFYGN